MCYNGKDHDLITIYSVDVGWNEEREVRWCKKCGSVCVAKTSDSRTFGYLTRMHHPEYVYEYFKQKEARINK